MARSGMEIMIATVVKALGIDPTVLLQKIDEIKNVVHSAGASIAEIRTNQQEIIRQNRAIMAHLRIDDDGQNARQLDYRQRLDG